MNYVLSMFMNTKRISLYLDLSLPKIVARKIFEKLGKDDNPIPLKKVIKFLEKNPQIAKINSNIPIGVTRIWD